MASTNKTPNLGLSQFQPLDKPAWLGDYNQDMSKIDTAVHNNQTKVDSMETNVNVAISSADAATKAAQAATEAAAEATSVAQNAQTTANNVSGTATQALAVAQQAQESVNNKVDKSGDTMTGALTITGSDTPLSLRGEDGGVLFHVNKAIQSENPVYTLYLGTIPALQVSKNNLIISTPNNLSNAATMGIEAGSDVIVDGLADDALYLSSLNLMFINTQISVSATIPSSRNIFQIVFPISGVNIRSFCVTCYGPVNKPLTLSKATNYINVTCNNNLTTGNYLINGWVIFN